MATTPSAERQEDPGGSRAAIDRYRDLAKYLIAVFAAVGALLVAGTQLSSLGKLSLDDTPGRVVAVIVGLALAIGAVARVLSLALRVLQPIEMSLDEVLATPELVAAINDRPSLLAGADSIKTVRETLQEPLLSDEERGLWAQVVRQIVALAAFRRATTTFESTWRPMLLAAIVGVVGISSLAWGANPPTSATADAVVQPAPVIVTFKLTGEGRETLDDALGTECSKRTIRGLSIGGKEGAPRIVTLPDHGCELAQFVLDADWGAVISAETAPTK